MSSAREVHSKNNVLHRLQSIEEDANFVAAIIELFDGVPVFANLRCGLWYFRHPPSTLSCYFKSTDGHVNNWSFNCQRLNVHVATIALERGGCLIVDSTRKGKVFPDSLSKTVPIWACVINRTVAVVTEHACSEQWNLAHAVQSSGRASPEEVEAAMCFRRHLYDTALSKWDCELHTPPSVVSPEEHATIASMMDTWVHDLLGSGTSLAPLASLFMSSGRSLRPLWVSRSSRLWPGRLPTQQDLPFIPIILVSASGARSLEDRSNYIQGAGDDEEYWAHGLTPEVFWEDTSILDRLRKSDRSNMSAVIAEAMAARRPHGSSNGHKKIGSTNVFVGRMDAYDSTLWGYDRVVYCGETEATVDNENFFCFSLGHGTNAKGGDRHVLSRELATLLPFVEDCLTAGGRVLICCSDGVTQSPAVCVAVLMAFFTDDGVFIPEKGMRRTPSKKSLRQRLSFLSLSHSAASPSRHLMKELNLFFLSQQHEPTARGTNSRLL